MVLKNSLTKLNCCEKFVARNGGFFMKVTKKNLADGKIELEAVASPDEVARALYQASIVFAQQIGLRPEKDKTIAQIAEEKMGVKDLDSIVRSQAIEDLVPFAIDKKNIVPAYPPKPKVPFPLKRGEEFKFSLVIAPKPVYELSNYEPVSISVPPFEIDESIIDDQIAQMAEQYAEYVPDKPRALKSGDAAKIAVECFEDGKKLENISTDGRTYLTGEGLMPDSFEKNILGMKPGDSKTFTFELPSMSKDGKETTSTAKCTVELIEIQKKVLPDINDDWVAKNMPLVRGVSALRGRMKEQLYYQGKQQYDEFVQQMAASELAKRFQGRIADEVYEAMQDNLMENLRASLQEQGMTFEQFVQQQGGQQQFSMMMMMQVREMLVQGYALDALYKHEKLSLTDADIEAACAAMNPQQNPKKIRKQMEDAGRGFALREAAERLKANKWLVEHANITIVERAAAGGAASVGGAAGAGAAGAGASAVPAAAAGAGAEATGAAAVRAAAESDILMPDAGPFEPVASVAENVAVSAPVPAKSAAKSSAKPAAKPAAKTTEKPAAKKTTSKASSTASKTTKSAAKTPAKTSAKPATKTPAKPAAKSSTKTSSKTAAKKKSE